MTYLDNAATTPMLPSVVTAVASAAVINGNPSSLHASGRTARRRVEEARESIAAMLGAHPTEVLFTSGGTESNNLAVSGLYAARVAADPSRSRILVSPADHHAVLETVEQLAATAGARVVTLDVDRDGRVHPDTVAAAIADEPDRTAMATCLWANNEVGTITDIAAIAGVCRSAGVLLHSDAVQAAPILPVDFAACGADTLAIAGHKLGGPGGTGLLLARRDATLVPLSHGGGQERGLRSGTLDVAGILGLAVAVQDAVANRASRTAEYQRLRRRLVEGIRSRVPEAVVCGDHGDAVVAGGPAGLPGIANLRFPGCESDTLLMLLDAAGVECSAGSACTAGVARASHVLLAMGQDEHDARSALRFSFGHTNDDADVDAVLAVIASVVARARDAAGRRRSARTAGGAGAAAATESARPTAIATATAHDETTAAPRVGAQR